MEETAVVESVSMISQLAGFIQSGGIFMAIILFVWAVGIAIAIERFFKLAKSFDTDGASFMNEIQRYILSNDIQGAIRVCSGTVAALPRVLKNGLKRANQGTEQIQNALDATALEVVPKVELRLNYLQLIANILTLLGLLGTIQGLMSSFAALKSIDAAQKAEFLSEGIATAMNTTFLGLITAITIMVVHAFLTSKSDKIINEIDEFSVKLLDLLGTKEHTEK